ncbi:protein FAM188B2 isoform X2 [Austrofundulus limnaeus]|uniref:Ubiquitin carboxyl-terminal hydrolase MINDY n=1 Tax=Austrofundulus limnaeus TaxID=52670 RepID=A0A2I4CW43_AUSLI|nr:PREDICTED: protein FAM188B2 isoform X2 [Austrofundulus limnaeus]
MEAEIQQILDQLSHLQQQRLESNPNILLDVGKEEDQDETSQPIRNPPGLCYIPRRLVVPAGLGGTPITHQLTEDLRRVLFGGTFHLFNHEWRKSFFRFREGDPELSYALEADRGGAWAIQMVVQARIIRYLLFDQQAGSDRQTLLSLRDMGQQEQQTALAAALSDSLWLAGQEERATVALLTEDSYITSHLDYTLDTFTETLQLFTFDRKGDITKFILDHIHCFNEESGHGVILFLYSLICSRTVDGVREDMDSTTSHMLHLSLGSFVCHQALMNLLLTGRACPQVFNGTLSSGEDGEPLESPLKGVLSRGDVGYLTWSQEQMERDVLPQVGSMLKTPRFPVWVCCINSSFSVLFSLNRSLLSDWKREHQFQLFYYNGQNSQRSTARLTIDTQSDPWEAPPPNPEQDLEKRFPPLEMTIRTKWDGAAIDWNGTTPFY